jgi:hypothetical protein
LESHLVRIDVSTAADSPVGPCIVTYTAIYSGSVPDSFTWEWRCTADSWTGDWELIQEGSYGVIDFGMGAVGSFDVRCTAHYGANGMGQADPDSTVTTTVNFHGPDSDTITSGLNVDSSSMDQTGIMEVTLIFEVDWQSYRLGCCVDGYAQEWSRVPEDNINTGWINPPDLWFDCGEIIDIIKITVQTQQQQDYWNNLNEGDVIDHDVYKKNRMVIKNCHGDDEYFEFPERRYREIKTGPGTFKLVVVP